MLSQSSNSQTFAGTAVLAYTMTPFGCDVVSCPPALEPLPFPVPLGLPETTAAGVGGVVVAVGPW